MTEFTVRRAVPGDAEAVVRMRLRAWRQTYHHLLPAEFFVRQETVEYAAMVERRRRHLEQGQQGPGAAHSWVGLDPAGAVVGVAAAGPGRDADLTGRIPVELEMIYLLARVHGTGLGQRLLDTAIGAGPAYLWIFRGNPRAERFYRRNGFAPDGAAKQTGPGWNNLHEFRMVRPAVDGPGLC